MPWKHSNPEVNRLAFEAWKTEGTIQRACKKLREKGVVSIRGKPFSPDGARKAAVYHMVDNFDESRKLLLEEYTNMGYVVEEDKIDKFLVRMAVSAYRDQKRVKLWMLKHNLMDKHRKFLESLIAIPND